MSSTATLTPAAQKSAAPWMRLSSIKLPWIKLPWPHGLFMYIFRTWLALAIGFYAAFIFELEGASSCGICVLILAQPTLGMVLSKAIYRTAGTLIGVVAALAISAAFPQDRTMLLASFAVWMGILTFVATLLRDFRAYGCVLAGYTVAIVSILNIDAPQATFIAAINRVAAILVGIAAITLVNVLFTEGDTSQSLFGKLRKATADVVNMALAAIDSHQRPAPEACVDMAARLMPLRSEISFSAPEKDNGMARAAGARSALLGLFEAITAIQAVGVGLNKAAAPQMTDPREAKELSPVITNALDLTRRAIKQQRPEKSLPAFDAMTLNALAAGEVCIEDAFLLDRLHFLIATIGHIRDGLRCVRTGSAPSRNAAIPVHQDYAAALLNATRVIVSIATVATLSVWSGIPDTAEAILYTSVFVALGSLQPNPSAMGNAGLFGMPVVILLSTLHSFFIFPNIDGYPLFILSFAPLIGLTCWLIMIGQPGYGLIIGAQTIAQVAPANIQTIDPVSFVSTATMLIPSGFAIFIAFRLVLPVQPALRRLRLALSVGTSLGNALADKGRQAQPRASLHYDRLCQFKSWQRDEPVTLARRKTMQRLADLGLLAYAVRRSWRALDRTRSVVPIALDAKARHILPSLSPDETEELAQRYLENAALRTGRDALALIHTAAALHGTALATHNEMRLLQRAELLNRIV